MSDTFFGFNSDLPELHGRLDDTDNNGYPLVDEDEDIDLVNDETFGDDIVDDWEEEHERLTANESSKSTSNPKYRDQEDDLEHSISQLVEEGDDGESLGMTKSESRQIPGKVPTHLDELFGPASPPAFLDTEHLVSPGKMDIWGSPTRPLAVVNSPDHSGQRLLKMLQTSRQQHTPPSQQTSTSLSSAHSVEAIEKELKHILISKSPQGFPNQDMEHQRRMVTGSPQSAIVAQGLPRLPHGMHTVMSRGPMTDRGSPPQFLPNANMPVHMMPNRFGQPPPAGMFPNQMRFRGMMPPVGQHRLSGHSPYHGNRPDMRRPPAMHQRPAVASRPPHMNHFDPPPHHQQSRLDNPHYHLNQQGRRHYEPSGGDQRRHDEYAGLMTQKEKDWVIKIQLIQLHTDNPYIDDYYYTTYCMRKLAKEKHNGGDQPGDGSNEPKLLLPAMAKVETRSYTPVKFEGSLGKLTASSVHKPRQILDVGHSNCVNEDEDKTSVKDTRRRRQLLIDIEKIYDTLLQIDDIEKKVLSMPEDGREALLLERKKSIDDMYAQLHCQTSTNDKFVQIACVRKGLRLIGRVLLLLDKTQAISIISALFRNITVVTKKDQPNNVLLVLLDTVLNVMKSCDFKTVVQFSQALSGNSGHKSALQNKFGVSVIFGLVSCADKLSRTSEDISSDDRQNWSHFLLTVAETIVAVPEKTLAVTVHPCSDIMKHFEGTIGGNLLDSLEHRVALMNRLLS